MDSPRCWATLKSPGSASTAAWASSRQAKFDTDVSEAEGVAVTSGGGEQHRRGFVVVGLGGEGGGDVHEGQHEAGIPFVVGGAQPLGGVGAGADGVAAQGVERGGHEEAGYPILLPDAPSGFDRRLRHFSCSFELAGVIEDAHVLPSYGVQPGGVDAAIAGACGDENSPRLSGWTPTGERLIIGRVA